MSRLLLAWTSIWTNSPVAGNFRCHGTYMSSLQCAILDCVIMGIDWKMNPRLYSTTLGIPRSWGYGWSCFIGAQRTWVHRQWITWSKLEWCKQNNNNKKFENSYHGNASCISTMFLLMIGLYQDNHNLTLLNYYIYTYICIYIKIQYILWSIWSDMKNLLGVLTYIQLEMHGCILSFVATDALVLKHQAISIHNTD